MLTAVERLALPEWDWPPRGATALVATCHGKEQAIIPALVELGLTWLPAPDTFESDRFGTFTRDIPRAGSQIDAARAKITAAFALVPDTRIVVASEGAFGPDPGCPIVPAGRELLLLSDRATGIELVGTDLTWDTNYAQETVTSLAAAEAFAGRVGFPAHGVIVMSPDGRSPVAKELTTLSDLLDTVAASLCAHGGCWLETDMRAHRNPRRMASIGRAAAALGEAAARLCPACGRPGFVAREEAGRPCRWCKTPTNDRWLTRETCTGCAHEEVAVIEPDRCADPGLCPACNP
jgi:hypothetical protein